MTGLPASAAPTPFWLYSADESARLARSWVGVKSLVEPPGRADRIIRVEFGLVLGFVRECAGLAPHEPPPGNWQT